jgi:hypothetical protein
LTTGGATGGRTGIGSTGTALGGRSTTGGRTGGSSFGGTSLGGGSSLSSANSLGGMSGVGSAANRTGGMAGFGGAAGGGLSGARTGSRAGGQGQTFAGGSFGPAIGRTGPIVGSALNFDVPVRPEIERRNDLQSFVRRSTSLSAPNGITVHSDTGGIVLRGSVANDNERRLVENMIRLQPGVRELRNELQIRSGSQ